MNHKKLIFSVVLSACSLLNAQGTMTMGKAVTLRSHTVSTAELFSMPYRGHSSKRPKCKKNADEGCIIPTPFDPPVPLVQNPNAPEVAFFPNAGASNQLIPPTQSVGLKFFAGSPQTHPQQVATPPDTMGVAGPEQFILAINQGIISFDKKTGKQDWILNVNLAEFGIPNEMLDPQRTTDPRIRYDTFSQRWFILSGVLGPAFVNNGFYLAVSDSSIITPCTQWKLLYIPNNTLVPNPEGCIGDLNAFLDYPPLGIDKHAVYIGADMFLLDVAEEEASSSTVFVIPKEQLLCSDEPVVTAFRDIFRYEVLSEAPVPVAHPADNFDDDAQFGYILATVPHTFGKLNLWRIVNPGSNQPSLAGPFEIDVPTTAFSIQWIGIPEKNNVYGIAGQLDVIPDLPFSTHVRNGQLYVVQTTVVNKDGISVWDEVNQNALGDRVGIRWSQIDLTGDPTGNAGKVENANTAPALVQAGTLFDARDTDTPLSYTMPSIMTNKDEDMVIGATLTGLDSVAKAFFVSRRKSDPLGTLRVGPNYEGTVFAESSGIFTRSLGARSDEFNGHIGASQRWGDYSMTSVDPCDGTTLWTIQEVHRGSIEDLWVVRLDPKKRKKQ